ncbi:MAG: helix-turn-helix transcriptional regulator [Clostridiales bacterium]|nr:helix-turn-helix transcriptional regulator [Clostridiales bacterium]MDD7035677.1 helix-turn-helix transcriptional regulator [Bacillota bacterium]MDY2920675.1 helix-turn-helix transcriptional regulator [Lentihominibacter sp.]
MLQKNDMMLLSDIIYKIYNIDDYNEMRHSLLAALKFLIPYEIATFYLASPDNPYELIKPVGIGISEERLQKYIDEYQDMDYTRWTFAAPTAMAYRETDLMNEEARVNTPFYKTMFEPDDIHYSAILTIIHEGRFYGCLDLFRKKDDVDFSDEEMFILDLLKSHLGRRAAGSFEQFKKSKAHYPSRDFLIDHHDLTLREVEILYLLLEGISHDSLCDKLSISPNTLKKHTSNIYRKMNVRSWRELYKLMEKEAEE